MKIIRNGIEFELTADERFEAWDEQQDLFDRETLRIQLDPEEYTTEQINEIVEIALPIFCKSIEFGCTEEWAADNAIEEAIEQFECA